MPHALTMILGSAIVLVTACASGRSRPAMPGGGCALQPTDSAQYGLAAPLYRECAVSSRAQLQNASTVRPDTRTIQMPDACTPLELEFVVDTAGRVEIPTARILRSTNTAYALAVTQMLPMFRYRPATRAGVKVRQIVAADFTVARFVVVRPASSGSPPPRIAVPAGGRPRC